MPRPTELQPEEVNKLAQQAAEGHLILDLRPAGKFGAGHIPGAINIGLGGQFASWAGSLIASGTPIIIVAEEVTEVDEAVTRLARVGIESVKGFLSGGMYAWNQAGLATAIIAQIPVDELHHQIEEQQDLQIVDVRQPGEYQSGHVPRAVNAPLAHLAEQAPSLDSSRPTAVICAGGYRSSAAASLLARHGFGQLLNVVGGTSAWINAGYPVEMPGASATSKQ